VLAFEVGQDLKGSGNSKPDEAVPGRGTESNYLDDQVAKDWRRRGAEGHSPKGGSWVPPPKARLVKQFVRTDTSCMRGMKRIQKSPTMGRAAGEEFK